MDNLLDLPSYFENGLTKKEEWELGVDEAGRGPVLGPMVYGCCFWPVKLKHDLARIGFTDSKALKEDERNRLFARIKELNSKYLGYEVKVLDPSYLSNKMLAKSGLSLNKMSYDSAIELIERALDRGINVVQCYLDAVGDLDYYKFVLKNHFRRSHPNLKFEAAEKAETKFPVVGAASICAKVTRDTALKEWNFRENVKGRIDLEFGSGYPGDQKTKNWLMRHRDPIFGFPDLVRFSWNTEDVKQAAEIIAFGEGNEIEGKKKYLTTLGLENQFQL